MFKVSDPSFWSAVFRSFGFDEAAEMNAENSDATLNEYVPYVTPSEELPSDTIEILTEEQRELVAEGKDHLPGVDPELLRQVKDNRPDHFTERGAWLNLFGVLRSNDPNYAKSGAERVGYVSLYWQPAEYRGRLVTIKGRVRRAEKIPFGKNEMGIKDYYRLVLEVPAGANPPRPMFVYVLEIPKDFPVLYAMREEVEISGFFYKKVPYQRSDGLLQIAPVVLARGFSWKPVEQTTISQQAVLLAALGLAGFVALGSWFMTRPPRSAEETIAEVYARRAQKAKESSDELGHGPTKDDSFSRMPSRYDP